MSTASMDTRLLTVHEVAGMLGIPEATLRWWRHADSGPRSIRLGRRIYYRQSDLEDWITSEANATARGGRLAPHSA